MQASRKGSKRLIVFDEVDVLTYIERGRRPNALHYPSSQSQDRARDSSRDPDRPGAGRGKSRDGFQTGSVPADLSLSTLLLDLLLDREKASTAVEEVRGDGGPLGSGHVWERRRLGHSSALPTSLMMTVGGIGEKPVSRGRADSRSGTI